MANANPINDMHANPQPEAPKRPGSTPRGVRVRGVDQGTKPSQAAVEGPQSKAVNRAAKALAEDADDKKDATSPSPHHNVTEGFVWTHPCTSEPLVGLYPERYRLGRHIHRMCVYCVRVKSLRTI